MKGDPVQRALQRMVGHMRNRLWAQTTARWLAAGLWGSAALLAALAGLHLGLHPLPLAWGLSLGLLPAGSALVGALLLRRPAELQAARRLDRALDARSLLLAAWDLGIRNRTPAGSERLLLARAGARLDTWRRALGGTARPPLPRSLPLATAAALGTGLLLALPGVPAHPSTPHPADTAATTPDSPAAALLALVRKSAPAAVTDPPQTTGAAAAASPPGNTGATKRAPATETAGLTAAIARPVPPAMEEKATVSGAVAANPSRRADGAAGSGGGDRAGRVAAMPGPDTDGEPDPRPMVEQVALSRGNGPGSAAAGPGGRLAPPDAPATAFVPAPLPAAVPPVHGPHRPEHGPALRLYLARYRERVRSEVLP